MTTTVRAAAVRSRVRSGAGWPPGMIQAARSRITGGHGQRGGCRPGLGSPAMDRIQPRTETLIPCRFPSSRPGYARRVTGYECTSPI
jgi:hypothetical protein